MNNTTKFYTDVFGRTTELDFDDIIRSEELMMQSISGQAYLESEIQKYYSSDYSDE